MVLNNSTTIESLDKEHAAENEKFNIGRKENWYQVFGTNKLFWFLPYVDKRGAPDGDGLIWKTKENNLSETNIELGGVDAEKGCFPKSSKNCSTNFNSNK